MTNTYSHALRILACAACGAPVQVDLGGGRFACSYCGSENVLTPRDESEDRARAQAPPSINEMERYGRLREQASLAASTLPSSLKTLVGPDGRLLVGQRERAKAMWLEAREELGSAPSFLQSERLFHLTRLLCSAPRARGRRALLETASELLSDEGHRHVLRCMLSRFAVAEGELDAAQEWLGLCQAKSSDLPMDTAYRLAAATLAAARERSDEVLSLLPEDAPLAGSLAVDCALLRIHALELKGKRKRAVRELERLREQVGPGLLFSGLESAIPRGLCHAVHVEVLRRDKERRVHELEGRLLSPHRVKGGVAAAGCFWIAMNSSMCWFFAFVGTGEVGAGAPPDAWSPGPLSAAPPWLILSCLALALLGGPVLAGLKIVYDGRRERRRFRGELAQARRELAELSAKGTKS